MLGQQFPLPLSQQCISRSNGQAALHANQLSPCRSSLFVQTIGVDETEIVRVRLFADDVQKTIVRTHETHSPPWRMSIGRPQPSNSPTANELPAGASGATTSALPKICREP